MNIEVSRYTSRGYDEQNGNPLVNILGIDTIYISFDENESYLYKDEIEAILKSMYDKMLLLKTKQTTETKSKYEV